MGEDTQDTKTKKIADFNTKQLEKKLEPDTTQLLVAPSNVQKQQLSTKEEIKNKAAHTKEVEKQEQKAKQQQIELERQEAQQVQDALKLGSHTAGILQGGVDTQVNKARDFLTSVPTPGGIASMLLILAFFLLFLVPVGDTKKTRAQLIYETLTGKTHLSYANIGSRGASGDFGTPALQDVGQALPGAAKPASGGPDVVQQNGNSIAIDPSIQQIDLMGFLFQGFD